MIAVFQAGFKERKLAAQIFYNLFLIFNHSIEYNFLKLQVSTNVV